MRRRVLGRTEIEVGEIGFGGLFASRLGPGVAESRAAVLRALDLGVNFFDTAPGYADSEAVLGRILREVRGPVVVSTKLGGRPAPFDPRDACLLVRSAEESLRALGRDAIDVLFVHEPDRPQQYDWWADPDRAAGPVVEALDSLKRRGLVRFTGLAGTTVTELTHLVRAGDFDVVLTAFNYSPLYREAVRTVVPAARRKNMGVVLGSVLHQGAFGRRYDDVVRRRPVWLSDARRDQILAFYALLDDAGIPVADLCLRFALSSDAPSVVLVGPKTARHVEAAAAAAAQGPLPPDVLEQLDRIAAMVPFRPFEEPMILPFDRPAGYTGPGAANLATGIKVGTLGDAPPPARRPERVNA
ncbi:aldo keto reductase : Aldo/keto reductase OS=Rhodopirellula baltica SH28 GN=RBSH_03139 PE=4 SV=1: Aldo_ket_red [Gemmataceae bacterium]|nr:aldo keto reductase : Aldo/keto reductase OS=Rhodopirellula baltica SH28 GN=RBSH_03139 PE=4 SV=1: Aldo_ket_red [Gemmataceae bacterium]VTU00085.1 aldo keto reductase : Aldo/keto reductase OS=Rhodopirellula baltica SH28 GN=RBSH_03139 PE=4 SV=1: Aldo_ket_red [Gemmataceae bacterium]